MSCNATGGNAVYLGYLQGSTTATSRINADGSATFDNYVTAKGYNANPGNAVDSALAVQGPGSGTVFYIDGTGTIRLGPKPSGGPNITIDADGSASFAGNKCGFTAAGEIYFTSRGTRYKIEVAGGLCNPVEFTREMELRERAEAAKERIDEMRKPRPTDSVPED